MKQRADWMQAARHKRSQNVGVVYTLLDDVMVVVDPLMRLSSRTESECSSRRMIREVIGFNNRSAAACRKHSYRLRGREAIRQRYWLHLDT